MKAFLDCDSFTRRQTVTVKCSLSLAEHFQFDVTHGLLWLLPVQLPDTYGVATRLCSLVDNTKFPRSLEICPQATTYFELTHSWGYPVPNKLRENGCGLPCFVRIVFHRKFLFPFLNGLFSVNFQP